MNFCRCFTSINYYKKSAGIGGGAIVNVLLIVGLGYNAKDSIAITYIFLMGGGLASSLVSATKKT